MDIEQGSISDLVVKNCGFVIAVSGNCALEYWDNIGQFPWYSSSFPTVGPSRNVSVYFVTGGSLTFIDSSDKNKIAVPSGKYIAFGPHRRQQYHRVDMKSCGFHLEISKSNLRKVAIESGSMIELAKRFGQWLVGHFIRQEDGTPSLLTSHACELKQWRYEGAFEYLPAVFGGKREFITVHAGILELRLRPAGSRENYELYVIHPGKYISLGQDIEKLVSIAQSPTYGLTVRWPSHEGIKRIKH